MKMEEIFDAVLKDEGKFTNDPDDSGGPTNYGILFSEWQKWVHPRTTTLEDFQKITPDDAKAVYRAWYWDPLRCSELPPGIAYMVCDAGILHGIFNSARWLQLATGAQVDSHVGPKTIAAVWSADDATTIATIHKYRMKRIKSRPNYSKFGRGWTNRLLRVKKKSLQHVR